MDKLLDLLTAKGHLQHGQRHDGAAVAMAIDNACDAGDLFRQLGYSSTFDGKLVELLTDSAHSFWVEDHRPPPA